MSDDCCAVPGQTTSASTAPRTAACPDCGKPGKTLQEQTLKALLNAAAMQRRSAGSAYFCPDSGCPVVYFGEAGRFEKADLAVPVFQKDARGNTPVCYCFGHTRDSIAQELKSGGPGPAPAISLKVKAGLCACELRNPQGSCCLGNVAKLIND